MTDNWLSIDTVPFRTDVILYAECEGEKQMFVAWLEPYISKSGKKEREYAQWRVMCNCEFPYGYGELIPLCWMPLPAPPQESPHRSIKVT